MTLGFGDVRAWRAAPLGTAGDGVKRDADDLEGRREQLASQGLPDSWVGVARMVAGILATGDGTRARPWTVLRVSDEYDVLRSLGRRPVSQELVGGAGRELDRIECTDGSEAWFDASGLVVLDG